MGIEIAEIEKADLFFKELTTQRKSLLEDNEELKAKVESLQEELDRVKSELETLEDFRGLGELPKTWTIDISDKDVMNGIRKTVVRLYGKYADPFRDGISEESKAKAVKQADRLVKGALLYVFLNDMHVNAMLKRANIGLQLKSALDKAEESQKTEQTDS